jgi:hypothetical protein
MTLWLSHGTCSYIRMYINEFAGSVMLHLQHDFYSIIFKIKNKLYITLEPTPRLKKNSGCTLAPLHLNVSVLEYRLSFYYNRHQGCGVESESERILGGVGRNFRWSRSRKEF